MKWFLSHRADPRALHLANAHYTRQSPESPQFVPPGRCMVLLTEHADELWVTSYPYEKYVKHAWAGAWICSLFRNESEHLSSHLITQAVAATRWYWSAVPVLGMVTFVDATKIKSHNPGCCYKKACFEHVGSTRGGLIALQLPPSRMPVPEPPYGGQLRLFDESEVARAFL